MRIPLIRASIEDKISEVSNLMISQNIGSVIIFSNGKAVGIVTEKDIINHTVVAKKNPSEVNIGEIMSKPLITISSNESIGKALTLMREKSVRRLAVIDDNEIVGLVTERRLLSIMPINKILVFIDESDISKKALEVSFKLAKLHFSKIFILAIIESVKIPSTLWTDDLKKKTLEEDETVQRSLLKDALAQAKDAGVKAEIELVFGEKSEKIVQIANEGRFSLIILGVEEKGRLKKIFLGDIEKKVKEKAVCPVFIVR
jgi:nucleotide-binding universal stress UspA family protein